MKLLNFVLLCNITKSQVYIVKEIKMIKNIKLYYRKIRFLLIFILTKKKKKKYKYKIIIICENNKIKLT